MFRSVIDFRIPLLGIVSAGSLHRQAVSAPGIGAALEGHRDWAHGQRPPKVRRRSGSCRQGTGQQVEEHGGGGGIGHRRTGFAPGGTRRAARRRYAAKVSLVPFSKRLS